MWIWILYPCERYPPAIDIPRSPCYTECCLAALRPKGMKTMTRTDVIVSIQGIQSYGEPDNAESVELVTSGELVHTDDEYILTYRESDLTGFGGTLTTLMIDTGRITMLRSGPVSTQMVFEEGRRHLSFYHTDEGSLMVGVQARLVKAVLNDVGGDIEMEYDVEIDHALSGVSHVKINVRKARGKTFYPRMPGIVYDRFVN